MIEPWLVSVMVAWQAPAVGDATRYEAIARDLASVVEAPEVAPLFEGEQARARTALLVLSVAYWESGGFARGVDDGSVLGDSGRSYCLMQIKLGKRRTSEGWSGRDLVSDRTKCFRVGMRMMRESMAACVRLPEKDRLSGYVRGRCMREDSVSSIRVALAERWWKRHAAELPTNAQMRQTSLTGG
jgi:hypothetical protein